jgi:hypothetical protein
MRAAAKWATGALAAVAAVLLAGGPLVVVGRITDWEHALWAAVALVVSLTGVGWAIWQAVEALMPSATTMAELDGPEFASLREQIQADPAAFLGPFGSSVLDLDRAASMWETAAANIAVMMARPGSDIPAGVLAQGLADARANATQARARLRWLVEYAHAVRVRNQLRGILQRVFLGAAVAAIGALLFVFAASQPSSAPASHASGAQGGELWHVSS